MGVFPMEEFAYILDFLPQGAPSAGFSKKEPLCYAVGEEEFKLFELVTKPNAVVAIGARTFIGKDSETQKRDMIDHVKRRITFNELTSNAVSELEFAITDIVMSHQDKYIKFFNEAEAISMRKHLLEELPGLGKKSMTAILDERKKGNFKDFEDLATRAGIKTPEKLIVARILLEIEDPERKRYLFVSR
jgi:putative nucleotide binding protein